MKGVRSEIDMKEVTQGKEEETWEARGMKANELGGRKE